MSSNNLEVYESELDRFCLEAKVRYKIIENFLLELDDEKGFNLLENILKTAREYVANSDKGIRNLVRVLAVTNRYLFRNYEPIDEIPIGGVYSLKPNDLRDNHEAVGLWANYLVRGLEDNS